MLKKILVKKLEKSTMTNKSITEQRHENIIIGRKYRFTITTLAIKIISFSTKLYSLLINL